MIQLMRKLGNKELYVAEDKDIVSPENIQNLFLTEGAVAVGHFRSTNGFEACSNEIEAPPNFPFIRADIALWASIDLTC
jgi:hypothetical protein